MTTPPKDTAKLAAVLRSLKIHFRPYQRQGRCQLAIIGSFPMRIFTNLHEVFFWRDVFGRQTCYAFAVITDSVENIAKRLSDILREYSGMQR